MIYLDDNMNNTKKIDSLLDKAKKTEEKNKAEQTEKEQFSMVDIELEQKLSTDEVCCAEGICKAGEVDEEQRTVEAIISTGVIDRDSEVLSPKGMDMDNFVKNPVIPWSHDTMSPPIGRCLWVKRGTKRIIAKVKFATTERANEVWELFKGGFLNAFSVGFMPKEGHRPTPEEIKKMPELADCKFIFDKWELTEFSPVTVPANPEALALAVKSKALTLSDEVKIALEVHEIEDEPEENDPAEVLIDVKEFRAEEKKVEVVEFLQVDKI